MLWFLILSSIISLIIEHNKFTFSGRENLKPDKDRFSTQQAKMFDDYYYIDNEK